MDLVLLERRLDDRNYDILTQSTKRKEEINSDLTTSTKVREETKIDLNDVSITDTENIIDNDNNRSNSRSIYGDEERITSNNRTIYGDEERITSISKKSIYPSYKDACMNNTLMYRRENITHTGIDNATKAGMPPVTSE